MSKKYLLTLLAIMIMSSTAFAAMEGGYSNVRTNMTKNDAYSNVVNDYTFNETKNVSNTVIKEQSSTYGYNAVDIPSSGVNNSKTIYTDELGRLHFFRKDNLTK